MQKYSIFSLIKNAFSNHQNWDVAWRDPQPKKEKRVVPMSKVPGFVDTKPISYNNKHAKRARNQRIKILVDN